MIFKNKLNTAIEEYRNRHHILYEYNLNQDIDQAETKAVYTVSKDGVLEMKYTPKFSLFEYPFFNFISSKCEKLNQDNTICYPAKLDDNNIVGQMFCFASEYSFQVGDVLIYHKNVERNGNSNHRLSITIGNEETVQSYQQSFSFMKQPGDRWNECCEIDGDSGEVENVGSIGSGEVESAESVGSIERDTVLYQLKPKESAVFWQYTENMKQGEFQLTHWRQDSSVEEQNIEKILINGKESRSIAFYKADEAVEIHNERFRRPFDALQQSNHIIVQGICEEDGRSSLERNGQNPDMLGILDRETFQIGQDDGWIYLVPVTVESNVKTDIVIIGNGQHEVEVYDVVQKQWRNVSEMSQIREMSQMQQEAFSGAHKKNAQCEIRLRIHMKAFSKIAKIMIALREE